MLLLFFRVRVSRWSFARVWPENFDANSRPRGDVFFARAAIRT